MKKPLTAKKPKIKKSEIDEEMSRYGISRVPMDDQYQFGNYRYTSLEHAISQAKREAEKTR